MLNSNSSLPPQPWSIRFPQLDMTIRFSDYGPPLPNIDVAYCLLDAANNVIRHWGQLEPIGATALITSSGNVKLQLVLIDDMDWFQYGSAIIGITYFVKTYEAVRIDLGILIGGTHLIAAGVLSLGDSNHT